MLRFWFFVSFVCHCLFTSISLVPCLFLAAMYMYAYAYLCYTESVVSHARSESQRSLRFYIRKWLRMFNVRTMQKETIRKLANALKRNTTEPTTQGNSNSNNNNSFLLLLLVFFHFFEHVYKRHCSCFCRAWSQRYAHSYRLTVAVRHQRRQSDDESIPQYNINKS